LATVNLLSAHIAGDIGGNGISRLAFTNSSATLATVSDANAAGLAAHGLFDAIKSLVPIDVGWTIDPVVQSLEATTGGLQGDVAMTSIPLTVQGTGTGVYAAGVGARGNWHTGTIKGRRFVRGATFLVPLIGSAFGTNGQIDGSHLPTIITACGTYLTTMISAAVPPQVWHRPSPANPSGGIAAPIVAVSAPFTAASLRSRRV